MSYANASSRYLENDIQSRPAEWLVPLLYEHLLASLNRASVQIEAGDVEGKAASLGKASAILGELLASLDHDKGSEVAASLASLYSYFALEIMNVGRTMDTRPLARLIPMIGELHEAWVLAAEQVAPRMRATASVGAASAA
jgi:flagellar secretion chaperone FliS